MLDKEWIYMRSVFAALSALSLTSYDDVNQRQHTLTL